MKAMKTKYFLAITFFLILCISAYTQLNKKQNVIIILFDTLSPQHLECYGYNRETAKNICAFAKENIIFKNVYSNSFYTLPSHVSLFTGLLPKNHRLLSPYIDVKISSSTPTLAEMFFKSGFNTTFIGNSNHININNSRGMLRGFSNIINSFSNCKNNLDCISDEDINYWYRSIDIIKNNQKNFVFLHSFLVHDPYLYDKDFEKIKINKDTNVLLSYDDVTRLDLSFLEFAKDFYKKILDNPPKDGTSLVRLKEVFLKLNKVSDPNELSKILDKYELLRIQRDYYLSKIKNPEDIKTLVDLYDNRIVRADYHFKKYIDLLKKNNLYDNSLIIVMADHGEQFFENGDYYHNDLYNSTVKIPLIIKMPNGFSTIINDNVQIVDIYPTLLKLFNINFPKKLDGDYIFSDFNSLSVKIKNIRDIFIYRDIFNQAVINDKLKFYKKGEKNEIYNLKNDPQEKNNLINSFEENKKNELFNKIK